MFRSNFSSNLGVSIIFNYSKRVFFSVMADFSFSAKLVEAVERHPCLYNFHLKEYSNREKVQSAWEAVAREVENSGNYL